MADPLRPGSLAWYAAHEGKRGQYAQPQTYSEFAAGQEPGYGEQRDLRHLSDAPGPDMIVDGLSSLAQLVVGANVAASAPWWAKPLSVFPLANSAREGYRAWNHLQQLQGRHPTQNYQREVEGRLAGAMRDPYDPR